MPDGLPIRVDGVPSHRWGYGEALVAGEDGLAVLAVAEGSRTDITHALPLRSRGGVVRARRERDRDRRSDDLAWSLLEPLSGPQQDELVAAMRKVERLLTAGRVEIGPVDPAHPAARRCVAAYFAELDRRSESGFDPAAGISAEPHELRPPAGVMLLASLGGEPVGCGALKNHPGAPSEIKRMWVAGSARGLGIGRRLLAELERRAAGGGAGSVRLETNRHLVEAIALYRSAGYVEVPAFNDEPFADHWFEKRLA
jgi:ribosomal protein S18 acetylase RimI-like enzyme